jgi:hypothetical protein
VEIYLRALRHLPLWYHPPSAYSQKQEQSSV